MWFWVRDADGYRGGEEPLHKSKTFAGKNCITSGMRITSASNLSVRSRTNLRNRNLHGTIEHEIFGCRISSSVSAKTNYVNRYSAKKGLNWGREGGGGKKVARNNLAYGVG